MEDPSRFGTNRGDVHASPGEAPPSTMRAQAPVPMPWPLRRTGPMPVGASYATLYSAQVLTMGELKPGMTLVLDGSYIPYAAIEEVRADESRTDGRRPRHFVTLTDESVAFYQNQRADRWTWKEGRPYVVCYEVRGDVEQPPAPAEPGDTATQGDQVDMIYFIFAGLRDGVGYVDRSNMAPVRSGARALQLANTEYIITGSPSLVLGVSVGFLAVIGDGTKVEPDFPIGEEGECPLGDECPGCNLCTRAQIKAWADELDTYATSLNDPCLPVVAKMRAWLESK